MSRYHAAMSLHPRLTHEDREARREVLADALAELSGPEDPSEAAVDVVRALDAYMEQGGDAPAHVPREDPVADFAQRAHVEIRWIARIVLGTAVLGTIAAGIILSGWLAAVVMGVIWIGVLIVLATAS